MAVPASPTPSSPPPPPTLVIPEAVLRELHAKAAGETAPRLIVLSAPSGSGKDTVLRELRRRPLALHVAITCTTRPRRPEEVDGVDYLFLDRAAFDELRQRGELLEDAEYAGHCYGVPKQPIREAISRGESALLKIEVQGASIVKHQNPQTLMIFLAPPDLEDLERRLRRRGKVDPADLRRRLAAAERELAAIPQYDYLVVNHVNRVHAALHELTQINLAERCRIRVTPLRL
ncbi:MAG: guanylate kinase [Chloroflexota bacterium]|nr:guanylate kinase [Chloroflexota bacterium]